MNTFIAAPALGDLVNFAINSWIGPLFFIGLAAGALWFAYKRQLAGFLSFAVVAVIAAIFIFFGSDLFGKNGNISKAGKDVATKVNAVDLDNTTFAPGFLKLTR